MRVSFTLTQCLAGTLTVTVVQGAVVAPSAKAPPVTTEHAVTNRARTAARCAIALNFRRLFSDPPWPPIVYVRTTGQRPLAVISRGSYEAPHI